MKKRPLTIIDLFCGTGGFAQGFLDQNPRYELRYALDLDAAASATARLNHPNVPIETIDIRKVPPSAVQRRLGLKHVDVIVGGPPCQGFSSLRPNRSSATDDDRNNLYLRFAGFVAAFRPKAVVLENVVGLITHRSGQTLERLLMAFSKLGYRVDWRILNAASYGVPQKRERFIMIAGRDNAEVCFPEATHRFEGNVVGFRDKSRLLVAKASCPTALSVSDAIGDLPELGRGEESDTYSKRPQNDYQAERRAGSVGLTLHKAAKHSDKMMEVIRHAGPSIASIPRHLISSGFSSCYSRLAADQPATTITVKFQSPASNKCIHPTQHRTLTPREAARIQSFDDRYIFAGSITQIAAQIGNAVPPLLGRAIGGAISKMIS